MAEATTTVGLTDLKFRLARDDFADAVAWVAKNLPTRPTAPVLAGVLLTGSDDGLTISGFDYEVSADGQAPSLDDKLFQRVDQVKDFHVWPAGAHALLLSVL